MLFLNIILGILVGYGTVSLANDIGKLIGKFKVIVRERKIYNKVIESIENNKVQFKDRFDHLARFIFLDNDSREILIGISFKNKRVFFIEGDKVTYSFAYYEKELFNIIYNAFHKELIDVVLTENNLLIDRKTYERMIQAMNKTDDSDMDKSMNISSRLSNQQILNNLLDKINQTGYDSLTQEEKQTLELLSKTNF